MWKVFPEMRLRESELARAVIETSAGEERQQESDQDEIASNEATPLS